MSSPGHADPAGRESPHDESAAAVRQPGRHSGGGEDGGAETIEGGRRDEAPTVELGSCLPLQAASVGRPVKSASKGGTYGRQDQLDSAEVGEIDFVTARKCVIGGHHQEELFIEEPVHAQSGVALGDVHDGEVDTTARQPLLQ